MEERMNVYYNLKNIKRIKNFVPTFLPLNNYFLYVNV